MTNSKDYWNYWKVLKVYTVSLLLLLSFSNIIYSQTEPVEADSVQLDDSLFTMKKTPMSSVWRSALIPGWGQIYNESYWKAPVIWGILGYLSYGWISTNNLYSDYKTLYSKSLLTSSTGNDIYLRYREFYRDQRDLFAVYIALTYFLNLVDAYVDAHLFDFDYLFDYRTNSSYLQIKYSF